MNTKLVAPIVLSGIIFAECALSEQRLQATLVEQVHIDVSVETPQMLDCSNPNSASGNGPLTRSVKDALQFSDSVAISLHPTSRI